MIKVCDAIMGSGKTSAVINYINEHPERHYLYISPFLEEAARIKECCPAAGFIEPQDDIPAYHFRKGEHLAALVAAGENVASTHQSVMFYTEETLKALRDNNYCLIIDEEIEPLHQDVLINSGDVELLLQAGCLRRKDDGGYEAGDTEYAGTAFRRMFNTLQTRELIELNAASREPAEVSEEDEDEDDEIVREEPETYDDEIVDLTEGRSPSLDSYNMPLWCWKFPIELLTSVQDIYVLTYMFKDSDMDYYLRMNDLSYQYIYIQKDPGDDYNPAQYHFSDTPGYIPGYVAHLADMIQIEQAPKLNAIGDGRGALSKNWYNNNEHNPDPHKSVDQLKRNLKNYWEHYGDGNARTRLVGSYADKKYWDVAGHGGGKKARLVFNSKSTNAYRERTVLAYPVNLFQNLSVAKYYSSNGFTYSHNRYALSTMIQWIWRSAIRDGKPIHIYVPSKRMRDLLTKWIEETSKMGVSES